MNVAEHTLIDSRPLAHIGDDALCLALAQLGQQCASQAATVRQLRVFIADAVSEGACDAEAVAEMALGEVVLTSNGRIRPRPVV